MASSASSSALVGKPDAPRQLGQVGAACGSGSRATVGSRLGRRRARRLASLDFDAHRVALELVDLILGRAGRALVAPAVQQHEKAVAVLRRLLDSRARATMTPSF